MSTIQTTLNERGSRYGEFKTHAAITMSMKRFFRGLETWNTLTPSQQEALDMIAHKIGRIINPGADPNYADSWVDIAGYATLVAQEIEEATTETGEAKAANETDENSTDDERPA